MLLCDVSWLHFVLCQWAVLDDTILREHNWRLYLYLLIKVLAIVNELIPKC